MSMAGNDSFMDSWVSDELFGEIMNYYDFPMENFEEGGDWSNDFQTFGQIDSAYLHGNGTFDALPIDLVTDLKQHPNKSEEPSKSSITLQNDSSNGLKVDEFQAPGPVTYGLKSDLQANCPISVSNSLHSGLSQALSPVSVSVGLNSGLFQAPSPVSVLESTQSCSGENTILAPSETSMPLNTRSKRMRKTTYKTRFDMEEPVKRKPKKKKKLSQLLCVTGIKDSYSCSKQPAATKKCTHCKVSQTPQWREGPMGPKTLCNACGVRYRSGRLLPEYRPAASPTFVPSLHSNSHKKVIEMRKKCIEEAPMDEMLSAISGSSKAKMESAAISVSGMAKKGSATSGRAISPPPEFVPMSSYLFDYLQD